MGGVVEEDPRRAASSAGDGYVTDLTAEGGVRVKIYLASSWRNIAQPVAVRVLRKLGHRVYDFRSPGENVNGFAWGQLGLGDEKEWGQSQFVEALQTKRAQHGFKLDMNALKDCDVCVLLQPCGNSAHLELGWAASAGKLTAVVLETKPTADLMLLVADKIFYSMNGLIDWLADEAEVPCRAGRGWGPCRCRSCEADRRMDP